MNLHRSLQQSTVPPNQPSPQINVHKSWGLLKKNADGQTTLQKSAMVKHMTLSLMSISSQVTKYGKQVPDSASDQILSLANFIDLFISPTVTFFKIPSTETDWRKGASGGVYNQTMSSL